MARRGRTRTHGVLEWITDFELMLTAGAGTPVNEVIDLDLMPDEIAEIWNIHSEILPIGQVEVDNSVLAGLMLSMDPSNAASPLTDDNLTDLEVFYTHRWINSQVVVGAATAVTKSTDSDHKQWNAVAGHPILVGTNIGMSSDYTDVANITSCTFVVTIYFTRRKANAQELNQILLKRR